ncbi:hypothetical protein ACKAAW_003869 [Enterobacter hormaechei]
MQLNDVFGVSRNPVASYIERPDVDDTLSRALGTTKQIVIYGSSKQGKTALLQRHLSEAERVTYHCGPTNSVEDIYRSYLRSYGVEIVSEKTNGVTKEATASLKSTFSAVFPFLGKAEAEVGGEVKGSKENQTVTKPIEFNLSSAQDVGELLIKVGGRDKFHVLENFHYLELDVQQQLAFDLRTFEEMGLRFIILGVWREKNRLIQFNGDLQDRVAEVPVEPWEESDFALIAQRGEKVLNVNIDPALKTRIFTEAHGSVAVVQELLKKICELAGIDITPQEVVIINDASLLQKAIEIKIAEYSSRHVRSLESIAAGSRTRGPTEETVALYLPYYLVKILVSRSYSELRDGLERKAIQDLIKELHTHPDNVRTSDVTGTLTRLPALQTKLKIVPPLFDYDRGTRRLKVVDSTLYFFIDNCNPDDVMDEIPHPEFGRLDD